MQVKSIAECSKRAFCNILPFLRPNMGVIPNPKMVYIFPIPCILAFIFQIVIKKFPNVTEKVASQNPK